MRRDVMTTDEMSCRELVELVTEYLEGTLPEAERLCFREHLDKCPSCFIYLEQMRQVIRTLGRLCEESLTPDARRKLLCAFRGWRRSQPPPETAGSSVHE